MDERAFHDKLAELVDDLNELPVNERERLTEVAQQARARHEKMRRTIQELAESLDHLRLSVKYLVFDLEATRRENAHLRSLLERQNRGQSGPHAEGSD
ncbi:MAG: transcriptional regulator [Phycisphaerales bacterium]